MMHLPLRVAVLCSAATKEAWAADSIEWVIQQLTAMGHTPLVWNAGDDRRRLLRFAREEPPDVIWRYLTTFDLQEPDVEVWATAFCELLDVPYTGPRPIPLALTRRRHHLKTLLKANHIPTPRWTIITDKTEAEAIPFPGIVKLAREHGSNGISMANYVGSAGEARKVIADLEAQDFAPPFFVEQYIPGRELRSVAFNDEILPTMEWCIPHEGKWVSPYILTAEMKGKTTAKPGDRWCMPAQLPDKDEQAIRQLTRHVYEVLDLYPGPMTVDYRWPHVIDVNCSLLTERTIRAAYGLIGWSDADAIQHHLDAAFL